MEFSGEFWILTAAFLLTIICITLLYLGTISGMFCIITVKTTKPIILNKPCLLAYKFFEGTYGSVGAYYTEASSISLLHRKIGIYFDDPTTNQSDNCRAAIGSILPPDANGQVSDETKKAYTDHGYSLHQLPGVDMVVTADFPYTTFISVYLAVARVYPQMRSYIEEHQLKPKPFIEIYEGDTIHFIAPLDHHEDFLIPEVMPSLVLANPSTTPEKDDSSSSSFEIVHQDSES